VIVFQAGSVETRGELGVEDLLENIPEAPIILFQDGVFGRQIDRHLEIETVP